MIREDLTEDRVESAVQIGLALVVLSPLFLPSLLYRWSLKATWFLYTPLLWVVREAEKTNANLGDRLKSIQIGRIARNYSLIVIGSFLLKFALLTFTSEFAQWWDRSDLARFAAIYVVPTEIPLWQAASAINAALVLVLYLAARRIPGLVRFPQTTTASLITMKVVRTTLTLYTVACTLWITLEAVETLDMPRLGTKLFPWMA